MLSLYLKLKKLYNMKQKVTTTFLSAWTLGILIIVLTAMTSCANGSGYSACAAYACVDVEICE